jgi:hypothetical protein
MNLTNLNIQYITDSQGEKKAVILPIHEFEEILEDLEDLVSIATRQHEETTEHDDFIKELKRDGFLSN